MARGNLDEPDTACWLTSDLWTALRDGAGLTEWAFTSDLVTGVVWGQMIEREFGGWELGEIVPDEPGHAFSDSQLDCCKTCAGAATLDESCWI